MNRSKFAIALLLCLATTSPVWAVSATKSVKISCTILPTLEMASYEPSRVEAAGNLGETKYRMQQDNIERNGSRAKLYSITAL